MGEACLAPTINNPLRVGARHARPERNFETFVSGSLMRERRGNQRRKLIQAFGHILAKMYPQRAPVPFG